MLFFVFLIPVVFVVVSWLFFKHKIHWAESLLQLIIPVIVIFLVNWADTTYSTSDTEYQSNTTLKVEYYEPWDEYVHRTCTRTVSCGKNCTRTISYDCSYVRHHSSEWILTDGAGKKHDISEEEYNRIRHQFGNVVFIDLDRNYYSYDGDKYMSLWKGSDASLNIVVTSDTYENRPQAASSVFNYPEVSEEDIKQYGLFDYPEITPYFKQDHLLGKDIPTVEHKLEVINAKLGPKKKLKLFIIVFEDKPRMSGNMQEWLWKNGNQNEFIVTIGLNKKDEVQWCKVISWTENQDLKISVRNFIESQDTLNWNSTLTYLNKELSSGFEKKDFKDFDYLTVELTSTQLIRMIIITVILCGGLSIWFVKNDFDSNHKLK